MQLPRNVRFVVMWMVFRILGGFIRSVFAKPASATPKKNVVECDTVESFESELAKAKAAKRAVVIDFTATWCGPCKRIAPMFADMSEEYDAAFLKVDVDKNSEVSGSHGVTAMPTFAFYNADGEKHSETVRGAYPAKIGEILTSLGVKRVVKTTEDKKEE